MPTDTFEKTNWGWQFSQLQQKVGEWLEYQFFRFKGTLPESSISGAIPSWLSRFLNLLFWVVLILFLAWVSWQLWQKFSPYLVFRLSQVGNSLESGRITEPELSGGAWLARSQELDRRGNYREACRCLYFAMLQHLHTKKILPEKPSRTNGEYLQLLRFSVTPMQPYETLMTTHEQICFSNTEINHENYQQCQQAYEIIANG